MPSPALPPGFKWDDEQAPAGPPAPPELPPGFKWDDEQHAPPGPALHAGGIPTRLEAGTPTNPNPFNPAYKPPQAPPKSESPTVFSSPFFVDVNKYLDSMAPDHPDTVRAPTEKEYRHSGPGTLETIGLGIKRGAADFAHATARLVLGDLAGSPVREDLPVLERPDWQKPEILPAGKQKVYGLAAAATELPLAIGRDFVAGEALAPLGALVAGAPKLKKVWDGLDAITRGMILTGAAQGAQEGKDPQDSFLHALYGAAKGGALGKAFSWTSDAPFVESAFRNTLLGTTAGTVDALERSTKGEMSPEAFDQTVNESALAFPLTGALVHGIGRLLHPVTKIVTSAEGAPKGEAKPPAPAAPEAKNYGEQIDQRIKAAVQPLPPGERDLILRWAQVNDPLTGMLRHKLVAPSLEYGLGLMDQGDLPGHFWFGDVTNFGSANKTKGHAWVDTVMLPELGSIVREEQAKAGAVAPHEFRLHDKGDELAGMVLGLTDGQVQVMQDRIGARIGERMKEWGLDQEPHHKNTADLTPVGIGIKFGTVRMEPGDSPAAILAKADPKGPEAIAHEPRNQNGQDGASALGRAAAREDPGGYPGEVQPDAGGARPESGGLAPGDQPSAAGEGRAPDLPGTPERGTESTVGVDAGGPGPEVASSPSAPAETVPTPQRILPQDPRVNTLATWQQTQGDYVSRFDSGSPLAPRLTQALKDEHRRSVAAAIEAGQPVPGNVLADYPELRTSPTAPPEEAKAPRRAGALHEAPETFALPSNRLSQPKTMEGAPMAQITPETIIKTMEQVSGVPMKVGHGWFNQMRAAGWYDPKTKLIRQKTANALDTASHEFGHAIHDQIIGWNLQFPAPVARELEVMGRELYGTRKPNGGYRREGFAEFMARGLLGDDMATAAPQTTAWFGKVLEQKPDFAQGFKTVSDMFTTWDSQGAASRVASKIKGDRFEPGPPLLQRLNMVRNRLSSILSPRMWTNDAAPLEAAERRLLTEAGRKPEDLAPDKSPSTLRAALRMNAAGTARAFIFDKALDTNYNEVGPSLAEVLRPIRDRLNDFTVYAYAKRAVDLHARGINPGISPKDAAFVAQALESPEFKSAAEGVTAWSGNLINYVVESGGLTKEAAEAIRAVNPIYVPLKRVFDEAASVKKGSGGPGGVVNQPNAVREIHGSGRSIVDPLESLVTQAGELIALGNRLQVARAAVDLAEDIPGAGWFANKVQAPQQATSFPVEQIKTNLAHLGINLADADMNQVLTVFNNASRYFGKDNIVTVWRGGKREFWEFHPDVFKVLTEMDRQVLPAWLRSIGGPPKRAVQLGATGLNASFGLIRNPIKDAMTWTVYSQDKKAMPLASMRGLWSELANKPEAVLWKRMGLELSTIMGQDRQSVNKILEEALATGPLEKGVVTLKHPIEALREFNGIFEGGPRVTEFKKVLETAEAKWGKGSHAARIEAALASKDVTVNFTRAGIIGQAVNELIPFFNAGTQGTSKFYRTFVGAPAKTSLTASAKAFAWITTPTLLLWWANRDEPWYRERPTWERLGYWLISPDHGETVIRLPKPFDLGYVFGSVPEFAMDAMYRKNPNDVNDAMLGAFGAFLPVKNLAGLIPAAIKPSVEAAFNYDAFRDRPIVSWDTERNRLPEDQYNRFTTETSKALGGFLHVSPAKIDHLIRGYTGGIGLSTIQTTEGFARKGTGAVKEPADIPVVGTLFARRASGQSASIQTLYTQIETLRQTKGSKKITIPDALRLKRMEGAATQITKLKKEVDAGRLDADSAQAEMERQAQEALTIGTTVPRR